MKEYKNSQPSCGHEPWLCPSARFCHLQNPGKTKINKIKKHPARARSEQRTPCSNKKVISGVTQQKKLPRNKKSGSHTTENNGTSQHHRKQLT